jgi:hypothetical protein
MLYSRVVCRQVRHRPNTLMDLQVLLHQCNELVHTPKWQQRLCRWAALARGTSMHAPFRWRRAGVLEDVAVRAGAQLASQNVEHDDVQQEPGFGPTSLICLLQSRGPRQVQLTSPITQMCIEPRLLVYVLGVGLARVTLDISCELFIASQLHRHRFGRDGQVRCVDTHGPHHCGNMVKPSGHCFVALLLSRQATSSWRHSRRT